MCKMKISYKLSLKSSFSLRESRPNSKDTPKKLHFMGTFSFTKMDTNLLVNKNLSSQNMPKHPASEPTTTNSFALLTPLEERKKTMKKQRN